MMRKIFYLLLFIFGSVEHLTAQSVPLELGEEKILSQIPKEKVYVHTNTQLLFSGEYLYYSFYSLNANTLLSSKVSTIGYVEMINEDNEIIFQQKLRITNGKAQGDYFIPVNVPSGNYKILGYTRWMLNTNSFFSTDIIIINPYQSKQNTISDSLMSSQRESIKIPSNNDLEIILDNDLYAKRGKVSFQIINKGGVKGNFTLSVREVSSINSNINSIPKLVKEPIKNNEFKNDKIILPELRGELISGKIIPINDSISIDNIQVSISISNEEDYIIKIASPSNNGQFYFNINEKYNNKNAVFEVLGEHKENFRIVLDPQPSLDYSNLKFNQFFLDESSKNQIIDRSIRNQIENGYFIIKPDSISVNKSELPFNTDNLVVYNLDEYTRFKTIKETLVEVTENVWSEKRNGKYVFQVRLLKTKNNIYNYKNYKPLVLIDGILLQNHDALMDFDARKVESISIIRKRYVYGLNVFEGVVIIKTIKGDYHLQNNKQYRLNKELFAPLNNKNYFKQNYSTETKERTDRIPDFRYQLLWEPYFEINNNNPTGVFYTSDVTGTFNISITGFTNKGDLVLIHKTFTVQ